MIDKPVDLTSFEPSNLPQLNEIISKICSSAATIKHVSEAPTATNIAEGEIVIYDNSSGTMGAYVITKEGNLFGINDGANFVNLGNIPAGAGVIPAANLTQTPQVGFGAWASKSVNTVYQATTDGFVVAYLTNSSNNTFFTGYSDGSNPPTTVRAYTSANSGATGGGVGAGSGASIMFPVRKNDYYKVTYATADSFAMYFLPLGS